jgi:hypothetical protein
MQPFSNLTTKQQYIETVDMRKINQVKYDLANTVKQSPSDKLIDLHNTYTIIQ